MSKEESGGLGAIVARCAEYVSIDTHCLGADAPEYMLVCQIVFDVLAYVIDDDQRCYVAILKVPAVNIWILESTLRWTESNLDNNTEVRERRRRIWSYILEHHARHAR